MLLGLGSDSEIKAAVEKSVSCGVGPKTHLDFENKINKEYFIKEIFQSLDWNDLYEKKDWWDVFGWDRTQRMKRVEAIVDEVMTEKKIESRNSIPTGVHKVEDLKSKFPLFKTQELAALANPTGVLRCVNAFLWDLALQRIKREIPLGCTDPRGWEAVLELSEAGIDHFKTLIRKGVDPKYLSHLSVDDRKTLIHIGNLYRDLGQNRDLLPDSVRKLFRACDKSNLILFALERKISEHRPFFEKGLSVSILQELNGKANGEMEKPDTFGDLRVLKELLERKPNFANRTFKVVKHLPGDKECTVWITNMDSLIQQLNRLPSQGNDSFNRAVQAAILQEALEAPSGKRPGALEWQISELTKDPESGVSFSRSPEKETTEIHDLGDGKVRIDHIAQEKILDGKKIDVGSCNTRFSYSLAFDGEKYSLSKLEIGRIAFEWNLEKESPFMSLKGGGLQESFKLV
jgi:hypothetical protein